MGPSSRDGSGYEPVRNAKARLEALNSNPATPGGTPSPSAHPYDRPALGIPAPSIQQPKATTPTSQKTSFRPSIDQEGETTPEKKSQDRAPLLGNKRRGSIRPTSIQDFSFADYTDQGTSSAFDRQQMGLEGGMPMPGRARSNSAMASVHPAESSRDAFRTSIQGSPAIESPEPNLSQFISNKGRPLSFYDLREQAKKTKAESIANSARPSYHGRSSWRSTWDKETAYSYGDMAAMAASRYYAPPSDGEKPYVRDRESELLALRLPWTMWMNSDVKNHFVAALGEWVGTTMFLFFAFAGTQVANAKSSTPSEATTTNATTGFDPSVMLYISLCFGFSLMVNVWVFFRISGGLFNPAVTLALFATRAIGAWRAICLFFAQIAGSITASALVLAIFPTPLNVRTTLSEGTSVAQGLFIEAFMTAELVFTILMLAKEKHKATFIAPVGIGLALFIAELCGVYYTGGSLNPARSLGPCIVTNTYDSTHWIYWLGPAIGCLFAIGFYKFIKILEYEMANPGQDGDDLNDPTKNPNHAVREKQREMTAKILSSLGVQGVQPPMQQDGGDRTPQLGDHGFYLPDGRTSMAGARADIGDVEKGYGPGPRGDLSTVASASEVHSPVRVPYVPPPHRGSPRPSMHDMRE